MKKSSIVERRCQDLRGEFSPEDVLLHPYIQLISDLNLGLPTHLWESFNQTFCSVLKIHLYRSKSYMLEM